MKYFRILEIVSLLSLLIPIRFVSFDSSRLSPREIQCLFADNNLLDGFKKRWK